jgi:hypothetical protein
MCEICDATETTTEWVEMYHDPIVLQPPAWANGLKWDDADDPPDPLAGLLACPDCLEKRKNQSEKPPPSVVGVKTLDLGAKIAGQS